jgi:N-acetylglucosamine kinase-like BadF-type ATPase
MKLFLGVDGGQSSTTVLIGDESGRVLGAGEAGPCNHAGAEEGRARFQRAVNEGLNAACAQAGVDAGTVRFESACLGMSGGPDDKQAILAGMLRAEHLMVTTDAAIALSGATATGQGIAAIAGTGSIAFGRNAEGRRARGGGWGYIFGDEGSGFDIARQYAPPCAWRKAGDHLPACGRHCWTLPGGGMPTRCCTFSTLPNGRGRAWPRWRHWPMRPPRRETP